MSEENTAPVTGAETPAAAPVEAVSTDVQQQAAPVTPEGQPTEPPVENKAKERLSLRFSELTNQRKAAEERAEQTAREAEYWRQQALSRQSYEPAYEDDGQDGGDINAIVERAVEARLRREAEAQAQNAQRQTVESLRTKLLESGMEGAALIATGEGHFTQAMFDVLAVSEQPAAIADHLGRNPAESARIAALTPAQQGVELARLEARLATQQPRLTSASPPPPTVGGRAVATVNPAAMSFEQYKAAREAGQI